MAQRQYQQMDSAHEVGLVGKRVIIKSLDWKTQVAGELVSAEKFILTLKLDGDHVVGIYKHAIGFLAAG